MRFSPRHKDIQTRVRLQKVNTFTTPVAPVIPAPANTVVPSITGANLLGSVLTGNPGTWTGASITYSYQWKRNGANIPSQQALTYPSQQADIGASITFEVIGTNLGGVSQPASSLPFTTVRNVPQNSVAPSISGSGAATTLLTGSPGSWSDADSLTYKWTANNVDIPGALTVNYPPTEAQQGNAIRFIVTAINTVGQTVLTSAPITVLARPIDQLSRFALGASVTGFSSAAPIVPINVTAGMEILVAMTNKISTQAPTMNTPGYLQRASAIGGVTPEGAATGTVRTTLWTKEAVGDEGGTTLDITYPTLAGNSSLTRVYVYKKDTRQNWDLDFAVGVDSIAGDGNFIASATKQFALKAGDILVGFVGHADFNQSSGILGTGQGLSAPDITFISPQDKSVDTGSSAGNGLRNVVVEAMVTAGDATSTPTIKMSTTTITRNLCGSVIFARLRQSDVVSNQEPVFSEMTMLAKGTVAQAEGTTAVAAIPVPVTAPAGAIQIMNVGVKLGGTVHPVTPAVSSGQKWKAVKMSRSIIDSNGTDVGAVKLTTFFRKATGGESGTVNVTAAPSKSLNGICGQLCMFTPDPGAEVHVDAVEGANLFVNHTVAMSTTWVAKSLMPQESKNKDLILVVSLGNTDNYSWGDVDKVLSQPGATFELVEHLYTTNIAAGADMVITASLYKCTSPTPVTDYLTWQMKSSASAARNPAGQTHFIRIRQSAAPQAFRPSRGRVYSPDAMPNSTISTKGGIWQGFEAHHEGVVRTGADPDFDIKTINGKKYFYARRTFDHTLPEGDAALGGQPSSTGLYDQDPEFRAEVAEFWQPEYQLGWKHYRSWYTKLINHPAPPKPYIICQDHPGGNDVTAANPEWSNHPIMSIEIAGIGQYPQDKGVGTPINAPQGAMIICHNTNELGGQNKYWMATHNNVPYEDGGIPIMYTGSKEIRVETMTKYGVAGQGRLFVRITDVTNSLVFTYDNPNQATVTSDEDPALGGLGVVPLVGGTSKEILYMHQNKTVAGCRTYVQAGIKKIERHDRYFAYADQMPNDADYGDEFVEPTLTWLRSQVVV